jgi:hypothetical protein
MTCVRVAGPWVVVPPALSAQRARVEFQLSCPRGFIVAGLDAELSSRAIDIAFIGKLGSPVNPGVSTSRAVVFVASFTGGSGGATTFRPHIGCIPASGGGRGPVPLRALSAGSHTVVPPGEPTIRRARTVSVRANARQRVVQECAAGERLVGGWHAVGFYTERPPVASLLGGIAATRTMNVGAVTVAVRSSTAVRGVRAIVQAGAVCAGGP